MKTKEENTTDKIFNEILSILNAKDDVRKLIELEKKSQDTHFNKKWALEKELDGVRGTAKEKNLKKQITLEENLRKSHMRRQFSLETKLVPLERKHVKNQIALQKILIKRAEETAETTKKESDINYLDKLTRELKRLESRWEALTEIL